MKTSRIAVLGLWAVALHFGTQAANAAEDPKKCISGTVKVADPLAGGLKPGATLFVYVREIDRARGAPTAVISIKQPRYPQKFRLCPADQMIPDSTAKPLSGRYRVYARHSASGAPMAEEGFLGTTAGAKDSGIQAGETVEVLIDQAIGKDKR